VPEFELPARADLPQLRRRAKELLAAAAGGDLSAAARIGAFDPRLILASAQLAVAREYGFASWRRLVAEVERRSRTEPTGAGARTPRMLVRYPSTDQEHYQIQIQQVPAGRLAGLVLASPVLHAHTVEEVRALAHEAGVPADQVHWLPPGDPQPEGPWQLTPDLAEADSMVEHQSVDGQRAAPAGPTDEQQAINHQRTEAAIALGGGIARGEPADDPRVIVVARQDRACLALIESEVLGWPQHGTHAFLVLWSHHNGRWEAPSTMSGSWLRADDEVFHTGATSWLGPDGPTWMYVVGHTMDPATPSRVRLGGRDVAVTVGRDGYFLGLIEALPGESTDDLEVVDPWDGGWRQAQLRADQPFDGPAGRLPKPSTCSFCGRPESQSRKLLAGPGMYICGDCAAIAEHAARTQAPVETPGVTISIAHHPAWCPFCGRQTGLADPRHPNSLTLLVAAADAAAICLDCVARALTILRGQRG
jgi:ClpX C4-type zinc finger